MSEGTPSWNHLFTNQPSQNWLGRLIHRYVTTLSIKFMHESSITTALHRSVQIPLNFHSSSDRITLADDLFLSLLPLPLPMESLISWISRAAIECGESLDELLEVLGLMKGEAQDFSIGIGAIEHLERIFLVSMPWFRMQRQIANRLFRNLPCNQNSRRLVMPLQTLKFCPCCMVEDQVPHFKFEWMFSFVRVCRTHGCLLEVGCQNCRHPIELPVCPKRQRKVGREIGILLECPNCTELLTDGNGLRVLDDDWKSLGVLPDDEVIRLQNGNAILSCLLHGYFQFGHQKNRLDKISINALYEGGFISSIDQSELIRLVHQHYEFLRPPLLHRLRQLLISFQFE